MTIKKAKKMTELLDKTFKQNIADGSIEMLVCDDEKKKLKNNLHNTLTKFFNKAEKLRKGEEIVAEIQRVHPFEKRKPYDDGWVVSYLYKKDKETMTLISFFIKAEK